MIVESNSFLNTNRVAVSLELGHDTAKMTAINNYWSTTDINVIDDMILDRNDDLNRAGYIEYVPFLTEPHPDTPIFILPSPTDILLTNDSVKENMPVDTEIGIFSSVDFDMCGSFNTFNYTLVPGIGDPDNCSFTIVGDKLLTSGVFNYEAKSSYSIRVRSTYYVGGYFEKVFVITVINTPEFYLPLTMK